MRSSLTITVVSISLATMWPTGAVAQWFPNPGLSAMNSSIQRDAQTAQVRSLSDSVSREIAGAPQRQLNTRQVSTSELLYKPSLTRRKVNLAQFVEKSRASDPASSAQLEKMFASTDIIVAVGKAMSLYGLNTNNLADAYAVYWTNAWLGSRGRNEDLPKTQMIAVRNQAASALLSSPELLAAADSQKQEMVEAMLVQAAMISAYIDNAKADPALMAKVKSAIAQGAKAMGLDLYAMTLTPNGFSPAKKGSALESNDDTQLAVGVSTSSDPSTPNYIFIAASGGAALGGMFLLGKTIGKKR